MRRNANVAGYGVDLSQQVVHFFNPHTDPGKIEKLIDDIFAGSAESGLVSSTLKSRENINASVVGHKKHQDTIIAKNKAAHPTKSNASVKVESQRVAAMGHSTSRMVVKFGKFATGAAIALMDDGVRETTANFAHGVADAAINNPAGAAVITAVVFATSVHKAITQTTPKMLALASLTKANFTRDRRHLDPLTEVNNIKAAGQLHHLKLGISI